MWKITILSQKILFFPILGGGGGSAPGAAPPLDPPLKGVIKICNSKYRQHKNNKKKKKKDKTTIKDLQNTTQTTKDRATWTPLKTGGELMCSIRVTSSCSIHCTHYVSRPCFPCYDMTPPPLSRGNHLFSTWGVLDSSLGSITSLKQYFFDGMRLLEYHTFSWSNDHIKKGGYNIKMITSENCGFDLRPWGLILDTT